MELETSFCPAILPLERLCGIMVAVNITRQDSKGRHGTPAATLL